LALGQEERSSDHPQAHQGLQVIVYAGLDSLPGKQRQLTRQVKGSYRQAEHARQQLHPAT
jgi:hypothetical protein